MQYGWLDLCKEVSSSVQVLGAMDALADGADANCVDSCGSTPLIAAINAGRSDIVAVLLGDGSLAFDGADVEGIDSTE